MTPYSQRIAIAEACGWTDLDNLHGILWGVAPEGHIDHPATLVPDYLNDLNAAHEMEKAPGLIVGPAEWDNYCTQLRIKIGRDIEKQGGPGSVAGLMSLESAVSATAAQRCEAFLRTLGLWKQGV